MNSLERRDSEGEAGDAAAFATRRAVALVALAAVLLFARRRRCAGRAPVPRCRARRGERLPCARGAGRGHLRHLLPRTDRRALLDGAGAGGAAHRRGGHARLLRARAAARGGALPRRHRVEQPPRHRPREHESPGGRRHRRRHGSFVLPAGRQAREAVCRARASPASSTASRSSRSPYPTRNAAGKLTGVLVGSHTDQAGGHRPGDDRPGVRGACDPRPQEPVDPRRLRAPEASRRARRASARAPTACSPTPPA